MQDNPQGMGSSQQQNNIQPPVTEKSRPAFRVNIFIIIAAVVLILAVIGGVYAYVMKAGPFAISQYTEKNLLSGILKSSSEIKSSAYALSFSLAMGERDAGAKTFVSNLSNLGEMTKKYENDSNRAKDISAILSQLKYSGNKDFPASLQLLLADVKYNKPSIDDPGDGKPYKYSVTENGSNFTLAATFETNDAISAIRGSYNFSSSTTMIDGKTVIFTKDSSSYFYLSPTPPKPFLVTLSDSSAYLPPESKFSGSISAQADLSNKDSADWKFNIDATGDYGDMTYKANVDALSKSGMYYFRINNIPGLFLMMFGLEKGQWVKIDPSKTGNSDAASLSNGVPEAEKYYKEHQQEIVDLLKKIITTADNDKLVHLKNPVRAERINGRDLFRYELEINKDAIVPFYKHLQEEVAKTDIKNDYPVIVDTGYIEYLQSPEFNEIFDYYQENSSLTLWTDQQGYPAVLDYGFRVVPPDSATQLKNKQANLDFKLDISDINKPVNIEAPKDYKDIEEYMKSAQLSPF